MMRLRNLFGDDAGVSPVVGVTLMVAITVILAAVMGTFALGVEHQTQTTPATSFDFDYLAGNSPADGLNSGASGTLTITHDSGQNVAGEVVYIRGESATGTDVSGTWSDAAGETSTDVGGEDAIASGDSATVGVESTYSIRVVWQPSESQKSATLSSDTGPDRG